jgi:exodeoxyribonuclease VII large subunit
MNTTPTTPIRKVYSVSELNRSSKSLLENHFGLVWIEGEVSNLSIPQSGHWYFTLKDQNAQINCAFFKGKNRFVKPLPKNGDKILIRTKVSLFEARGNYQLIVEYLEPAGLGALQRQFEELKSKLKSEGLFDPLLKQPIPESIESLGIITSATGAAIQDVLSIIKRRYPLMEVIIYPVMVQGEQAHVSIINAIDIANQRNEVDVLLLTRGGGSIEDMWCFNNEQLARVIAASELPIVSAVGHEIDFTISDFVADLRAATPSAAAELLTPDSEQLVAEIVYLDSKLVKLIRNKLQVLQQKIDWFSARLVNPADKLKNQKTSVIALHQRLKHAISNKYQTSQHKILSLAQMLQHQSPQTAINKGNQNTRQLLLRLKHAQQNLLQLKSNHLKAYAQELNALSPLATLERGYSITQLENGVSINAATELSKGTRLKSTIPGKLVFSTVEKVEKT